MDHDPDQYADMFEDAGIDDESLTVLLVRGGTKAEVVRILGADATASTDEFPDLDDEDWSAYALAEVATLGGAAAVARSNIQGHERFGCARDGVVLFDADEFMYVDAGDKEAVPAELRPMFDSAWVDLSAEDDADTDVSGYVAFAMAVAHTGVVVTGDDLSRAVQEGYHRVRNLSYLDSGSL